MTEGVHDQVELADADARDLPSAPTSFDLVVAGLSGHHIPLVAATRPWLTPRRPQGYYSGRSLGRARGRGLPGATVRARIPRVARSALSGITGKMAASFQLCSAADQS